MKTKLRLLGSLLILLLAARGVQAIVLLQDNFPYAAGPLVTESVANPNGAWAFPPGNPTYGSTADITATGNNSVLLAGLTSTTDLPWAYFTNGLAGYSFSGGALTNFPGNVYYFPSNAPVAALYASFDMSVHANPVITNAYFCYFTDTNFNFHARVFVLTNTASPGSYRLAIDNNSAPATPTSVTNNIIPEDLSPDTTYTVIVRYNLSTGLSTLWVTPQGIPINEAVTNNSTSPTASNSAVAIGGVIVTNISGNVSSVSTAMCGFGLRNHFGTGAITISSLIVGTTFEDVQPGSQGSNPAYISVQPQPTAAFVGDSPTLSVVAGGDTNLTYQWNSVIAGVTNNVGLSQPTLTLSAITSGQAGNYFVVVGNGSGNSATSSLVAVTVISSGSKPTISVQPSNQVVTLAGTATFSVTASDGGPPLSYQWYFGSNPIPAATNASLILGNVVFNQGSSSYSVVVSNTLGSTNSTAATLTVNPPVTVSIRYLHNLVDTNYSLTNTTTLFTIKGVVTTYHNLTTPGNSEFFVQDVSGGIAVFWSGAPASTNLPPPGALVQVTAPLSQFSGLLEIAPVFTNQFHSVTILSNNIALPTPLPLPFDTNIVNNPAIMVKQLQGSYFVASNVVLQASPATFTVNANEPITNNFLNNQVFSEPLFNTNYPGAATNNFTFTNQNGATFTLFYNAQTDFIGQPKPTGPVTIYGVLSQFAANSPYTNGYELMPTRFADIVPALLFTNVITHTVRRGDLATNSFFENVLQPGETLTMNVTIGDPGGGNVTGVTGLPSSPASSSSWSVTSSGGLKATATLTFTAATSDAGKNYTNSLQYTLPSGTFTSSWTTYVPTADEQKVRITEVFANPTTNSASPIYNPLKRATTPETNSAVNDQYVELANVSPDTVSINHWSLAPAGGVAVQTFLQGETLPTGSAAVVYGGPASSDPNPPTITPAVIVSAYNPGPLGLSTNGGVLTLHNNLGYLVDRVSYGPSVAAGSTSRFPTYNGDMVPQAYINSSPVNPGAQYDGGSWFTATLVPTGVSGVQILYGNPVTLNFTATPGHASTLWQSGSVTNHFNVVFGQVFGGTGGSFSISNPPSPAQFFYITTQ